MKCRGLEANASQSQLYAVFDNKLYHVSANGTRTERGTLNSRSGYVDMRIGVRQLVLVDGANGYVLDLNTNAFARITASGWRGSARVGYIKGLSLFADPGTGVFYTSALENAASLDTLDFATAASSPDNLVASLDDHGEAWLPGEVSTETWVFSTSNPDFPLVQNEGANMMVGCLAPFTARTLGGARYWLGREREGAGKVYRASGYVPQPISNTALEQKITAAIEARKDMSKAIAFTYTDRGHSFYWLQVPGLDTTFVYDTKSGEWHERSDFVKGEHVPHRAKFHAYCYGQHILGGDSGDLWSFDADVNNNAGDPLVRDRISPHYAQPSNDPIVFGPFELDCIVGAGKGAGAEAFALMRYSDDGSKTWSDWRDESLGAVGEYSTRVQWFRNGSGLDRVWWVRCMDDVSFGIVRAIVKGR